MAEMDIETLLFGKDVDCQYGDFEIKFETEGSFDDIELLEAVELIESQEMPAEKPVVSVDETDAVQDHGTPARGLESADKLEGKERFAVVDDTEMNQILAGATSCQTNKMTRWGVQQFKRTKAKGPTQYPTKQHQHQNSSNCPGYYKHFCIKL